MHKHSVFWEQSLQTSASLVKAGIGADLLGLSLTLKV